MLRRLLGLDAKMAQYRDGAVFVRRVVDRAAWPTSMRSGSAPENLFRAEIADPGAWISRVL